MVNFILTVYGRLGRLYELLGVDRDAFLAVLRVKLMLDDRRVWAGVHTHQAKSKSRIFRITLIVYGVMGIFLGLMLIWVKSPLTAMTFLNSFIMFVVGFTLVADFTRVLLDTRDNTILLPRPVGDRTLLAVRVAHIVTYLGLLSLSLSAGTLITGAIVYHPLFPLVYLVMLLCLMCLVVFFVFLFYMLAMHIFDMERFRDIILYFQILMTIFFIGAYQILPRMMNMDLVKETTLEDKWWIYVYPPAWIAAPFDLLVGRTGAPQVLLTLLGLSMPVLGILLVVRVLAPGFGRALSHMEIETESRSYRSVRDGRSLSLLQRLGSKFARREEERTAFRMLWHLVSRDRPLKLVVYPQIVFSLIMCCVLMVQGKEGILDAIASLHETEKHLILLYAVSYISPMVLINLRFSDRFEAAWCYHALPLKRPGSVLSASLKVVLFRFAIPLYGAIALITAAVWGARILPDILLAFCVMIVITGLFARIMPPQFPFSEMRVVKQDSGQMVRFMLFFLFLVAIGFGHWALKMVPWGVGAAYVVTLVLIPLVYHGYAKVSWWKMRTCAR